MRLTCILIGPAIEVTWHFVRQLISSFLSPPDTTPANLTPN